MVMNQASPFEGRGGDDEGQIWLGIRISNLRPIRCVGVAAYSALAVIASHERLSKAA